MTSKTASVSLHPFDFPPGTVAGPLRFRVLQGGAQLAVQDVPSGNSASFDLPAGTYTMEARRLDGAGNTLGSPTAALFTVDPPPPPVSITVPISLTVG